MTEQHHLHSSTYKPIIVKYRVMQAAYVRMWHDALWDVCMIAIWNQYDEDMNLSSRQLNSAAVPIMATRGWLPKPIPIDSHVKMFNFQQKWTFLQPAAETFGRLKLRWWVNIYMSHLLLLYHQCCASLKASAIWRPKRQTWEAFQMSFDKPLGDL